MTLSIEAGSEVTLHFTLARTDGTEAISTFGEDPTTLLIGDGSLTEGLAKAADECVAACPTGALSKA